MGSKHASIHLRCDDNTWVLACLKKEFGKKNLADSRVPCAPAGIAARLSGMASPCFLP